MNIRILGRMLLPLYYRPVKRFLADAHRSRAIQHEVLLAKLRRNAESDFGRSHGFAGIRSVEDFRRQVPVASYDYYRPYIDRVRRGELTAMFAPGTRLLMFALTSGTTSASKFIPITREYFDEYRRGWYLWGARNYHDHVEQLHKQTLQLSSDWRQFISEGGTPCGNISGLAAELAPYYMRFLYATPLPVTKIADPAAKHYTALRLSLASRKLGMIITANPSTLVELARRADAESESLVRDIHDGTLSSAIDVPPAVRQALAARVGRARPARAKELEQVISRTGHLYPKDAWTQLAILAVWLGGSSGVYLPLLKQYYGDTVLRDHGLSASEGRMTVPLHDGTSAGLLEYVNHFFEFIPEEEHDSTNPTVLEAHELEVDRNYFILLSTSAGLYRYDIHDVVRCVGFEGTAPMLEFLNKGAHFSSVTGEKLSEFQVVSAVRAGFAEMGLPLEHFTVAPEMHDRPRYVLLVEPLSGGATEELANRIDGHLQRLNSEYAEKMRTGRLLPLTVRTLAAGRWQAFRHERIAARGNLEEYKHPCLVNDLTFVERMMGKKVQ